MHLREMSFRRITVKEGETTFPKLGGSTFSYQEGRKWQIQLQKQTLLPCFHISWISFMDGCTSTSANHDTFALTIILCLHSTEVLKPTSLCKLLHHLLSQFLHVWITVCCNGHLAELPQCFLTAVMLQVVI